MKKIYSFLMALSIVLCANANSFEVAKSLEMSLARPQLSKKVNVTPSQGATPVINKTIQVKKQALNAQQQERKALARQAQSAPAVKVNGVPKSRLHKLLPSKRCQPMQRSKLLLKLQQLPTP